MDCPICCLKYTSSLRAPVTCLSCDDDAPKACTSCAKQYIINSDTEPSCMFCKSVWERPHLVDTFSSTFVNTVVKKKMEKVLYDQQLAQLPDTQHYVQRLNQIKFMRNSKI